MKEPPDQASELQRRLNPQVWREVFFWIGMLWAAIAIFQAFAPPLSSKPHLSVFTSCMFFIGAHEQLAKKRMKAMLDWIEYQKTTDKPQS
jgi:hypothetical protein